MDINITGKLVKNTSLAISPQSLTRRGKESGILISIPGDSEVAGPWLAGESAATDTRALCTWNSASLGKHLVSPGCPWCAHTVLIPHSSLGCHVSPGYREHSADIPPQAGPATCPSPLNTPYLLPPPIQAPQRCFVLPAASGHPSGPAPEHGGTDGQE